MNFRRIIGYKHLNFSDIIDGITEVIRRVSERADWS